MSVHMIKLPLFLPLSHSSLDVCGQCDHSGPHEYIEVTREAKLLANIQHVWYDISHHLNLVKSLFKFIKW